MPDISIIILAAGASSRLGKPKQLLLYKGKTLIEHAVEAALGIHPTEVIVILGCNQDEIAQRIQGKNVTIVPNENWVQGMGASLVTGIKSLRNTLESSDILLMVCDQPYVTAAYLNELVTAHNHSPLGITASAYDQTTGVPAIFSGKYLSMLTRLPPDSGAKHLLNAFHRDVLPYDFPNGNIDIDTAADYALLNTDSIR